jgi:hypothetical protein
MLGTHVLMLDEHVVQVQNMNRRLSEKVPPITVTSAALSVAAAVLILWE